MSLDRQKRKDATRALLNIVLVESLLLAAIVGVYLYTSELSYLVGGVVATMLIFGPVFLRWARDHGPALKAARAASRT